MQTTTTRQRDTSAVILGRDEFEAVSIVLGLSPTVQDAWDELLAHRTPAGFVMPEWRRRALAQREAFGLVAVSDTTGSVTL